MDGVRRPRDAQDDQLRFLRHRHGRAHHRKIAGRPVPDDGFHRDRRHGDGVTLAMPYLSGDNLERRMKSVAIERNKIRAREREKLAKRRKDRSAAGPKAYMQFVVEHLNLQEMARRGTNRAATLDAGRLSRAGTVCRLPVFPHDLADRHVSVRAHSICSCCTHLGYPPMVKVAASIAAAWLGMQIATAFSAKPHHAPPALGPPRVSGRARSSSDLRRSRHVDRSRVPPRQPGNRHAVDPARRGTDADDRRTFVSARPPPGL